MADRRVEKRVEMKAEKSVVMMGLILVERKAVKMVDLMVDYSVY